MREVPMFPPPLSPSTATHGADGGKGAVIHRSLCLWSSLILVMSTLTSSEPEKNHCPVILHRDIIKQNSQPEPFTA